MSEQTGPDPVASADPQVALDPGTRPEVLAQIAEGRPELRVFVAMNPSTYPGLVEWLATLGDPAVNAALASRAAAPPAPPQVPPPPPPPPPVAPGLPSTIATAAPTAADTNQRPRVAAAATAGVGPLPTAATDDNWFGLTSLITSLVGLAPVALVLGVLGIRAAKAGRASNRGMAVAGTVIGALGMVGMLIGVSLLVIGARQTVESADRRGQQGLAMQDAEAIYFGLPTVAAYDLAGQGTTAASGKRFTVQACDSISIRGVLADSQSDPVYSYVCAMDLAGELPIATMNLTSGYTTSVSLLVTGATTLECVSVTPDGKSAEAGHYSAADGAAPGGCS